MSYAPMAPYATHTGNFQPGDHVSLVRDPTRRGLIVDVVSTWRSVRWAGRGTSNHRPGELMPAQLSEGEFLRARVRPASSYPRREKNKNTSRPP